MRKIALGEIHASTRIGPFGEMRQQRMIHLGRRSEVGRGGGLHAGVERGIRIEVRSQLNPYTVIYGDVEIGSCVMIAPHVMIAGGNRGFERRDIPMIDQGSSSKGGVVIEDDVWVGANALIVDGVRVGKGAIIAAGAVVTRNVDAYTIVAGVPTRRIGERPSA